jgi:hypothetical protein
MNNKLERMWKDVVVACFKVLSSTCLEILRKTTKKLRIASLRVEI